MQPSVDVFPTSKGSNVPSLSAGYAELLSECITRHSSVKLSYREHVRSRYFSQASKRSALDGHVCVIARWSSKPQMIWSYAWRIIARVANVHAFRYRFKIVKNPTSPMSQFAKPAAVMAAREYASVTAFKARPNPYPAAVCFLYFVPETIRKCSGKTLSVQEGIRNFGSHIKSFLMCRASGCFSTAGAFLFLPKLQLEDN